MPVKIHVYSLCWNEVRMLPHYIAHYESIADHFFIRDHRSSDGSYELLAGRPDVTIERFTPRNQNSFVLSALDVYDDAWKQSRGRADWVIVCNIDEFLYHANLPAYLASAESDGVTAIRAVGYQMVSEVFPTPAVPLTDQVRCGVRWRPMDKLAIFDPNAIEDINYAVGRHDADPVGRVAFPQRAEVMLLHFKYLGLDYLRRRHAELAPRLGRIDVERDWGHKYRWSAMQLEADFEHVRRSAKPVI